MSDNTTIQDIENTNKSNTWIEEVIDKEYLNYYEYNQFSNIQKIGAGDFGKVYRANLKNSEKFFALKSFFNLDNINMKEIVREDNFGKLTWNDKHHMAYHGLPPFYAKDKQYDVNLTLKIAQGLREEVVFNTPEDYIKIYTKCWDGEPDNRPTIYQVVDWLKAIITKLDVIIKDTQFSNNQKLNSESQEELLQLNKNFTLNILGLYYKEGIEVEKNYNKAFELFEKSAEGGYSDRINSLGYCYIYGVGTNIDMQKAFELYQKSANLGDKGAQYNLAMMYEGITDMDKAIYWYEKSAQQGDQDAQYELEKLKKNQ
ncbi:kinase-like domain-containing protein [Rhizophagus irregularis DAOM 181602=DAOM 197198]|nr:kinase-like domain-containing protein [Rhizophagus irregularis DAOM 181602=DAOM 197198]